MESKFLTNLVVEALSDNTWEIVAVLRYQSQLLNRIIEVPAGFVTDFASVPRVPIVYDAFGDRAHHESVIHDYLYQTHLATKSDADKVFLEAMKARRKSAWIRYGMYWGVVLGGQSSYNSGPARLKILNPNYPSSSI